MTWLSAIYLAIIVRLAGHAFTVIYAASFGQAREYMRREIKHHERMFTWRQLVGHQVILTLILACIIKWWI